MPRSVRLVVVGLLLLLDARPSRADDDACATAAVEGQKAERASHLLSAREQFLSCAAPTCVADIASQCSRWLAEVEQALPTLVIGARDEHGRDLIDVRVLLDGHAFVDRLDGRPLPVDPGVHTLRFESTGRKELEQTIVAREGQKERVFVVDLAPREVASRSKPALGYVLLAVGAATGASWGYFGIRGIVDHENCSANCSESQASSANRELLVADISAGVTLVAAGIGTWLLLRHASPPTGAAARLRVGPVPGGVAGVVGGSF
jgi:hypothetical protein